MDLKTEESCTWLSGILILSLVTKVVYLVVWNSVTLPCNEGGLGIYCFLDLNVSLFSKWIYIYGNERVSL